MTPPARTPPRKVSIDLAIGAALTAAFVLTALVSLIWTPSDPTAIALDNRLAPASLGRLLGTDQLGRDVLSMLMAGARNSFAVAATAVGLGLAAGAPLGLLAAARRGLVEEAVLRTNDVVFAFPALMTALMITAVFGPGGVNAVIAIGIFNVPVFARVTRASALSLWTRDWILAARVAGKGAARISVEHILPNLAPVLTVQTTIQISIAIIAEAGLSYVGLGVQPPTPSWGRMLSDAQTFVVEAPSLALYPGLAILLSVLGVSLLGEALRVRLDPRYRDRV